MAMTPRDTEPRTGPPTVPASAPAGHPRRWLILLVMSLCMFVATLDNTILTVALAPIQQALEATNGELQWVMDAYALTFAALLFTAGLLGDRFGRRWVLAAGLLVFLIASAFASWSADPAQLIMWRALMGLGAAVVPGCSMAVIIDAFVPEERPKAIALWSVATGVGIAAGPVVGGALLASFWWGSALLVNVPLALVAIVLIVWLVPQRRAEHPVPLDLPGMLLSILAVGSLVYGIIAGGEGGSWIAPGVAGPIAAGLVLLVVLILVERRSDNPSIDPELFRSARFTAGSGVLACSFFVAMGVGFILTFYLQQVRGNSPVEAGLLTLAYAVGTTVAGAKSSRLADRMGPSATVAVGMAAMGAGCLAVSGLGEHTPVWIVELTQVVFGAGFGLTLSPAMAVALAVVPDAKAGAGSAVVNTVRHLGSALGVAVLGAVLGVVYRDRFGDGGGLFSHTQQAAETNSLGSTLLRLAHLGSTGHDPQALAAAAAHAKDSFLAAMQTATWIGAGFCLMAALIALRWLPGRPSRSAGPHGRR
ncbi:MFS transporter [Streptomyces sp. NBC_00160]|uniref:MFS transporter n=1 Tax=Streptomyces sp. NBC_00160 TaxID=2903628 RepID=UPI00225720E0|nr:MFS transporter [Streptomyces sp. NBC_00160]MCX5308750.1 MFS transporter [Streptomyces sp. NBC_00160]